MNETKSILIAWEQQRIAYNAVLLVVGLILLVGQFQPLRNRMSITEMILSVLAVAVSANLAYFSGVVLEVYTTTFLGWRWQVGIRQMVFWLGVVFSIGVFLAIFVGVEFWLAIQGQ